MARCWHGCTPLRHTRRVTFAAWVLFLLAAPVAAANWWSRARDDDGLERLTKPAVTALLVAAALLLDPASSGMRLWFVAALVLCLVGDVLLLPPERFVPGLAAFLAAHIAFVFGFVAGGLPEVIWAGYALIVLPIPLAIVGTRVIGGASRRSAALGKPVALYMGVIGLMVVIAVAHANPWGIAGAAAFLVSDGILGWNKFVTRLSWAPVAIMVTYHLALAGLVLALP
jgi:uncharacterized membrane protein YhhN